MMKTGVILMSMIEPESAGDDLTSFLYAIFSDHDLVKVPRILQKPFAYFMAGRITEKYRGRYQAIGGSSPQMRQTIELSERLSERLMDYPGEEFIVRVANRYGCPRMSDVLEEFAGGADAVEKIVLLPLYPQYSASVTGSSFGEFDYEFERLKSRFSAGITVKRIRSFPDYPPFVASMAEMIREGLADDEIRYLLFTAHAVPKSFCEQGDPYIREVKATVAAVMDYFPGIDYSIAYHAGTRASVDWTPPLVDDVLRQLASGGVESLAVVPVCFLTEHTETLYDLDYRCRRVAEEAGIRRFLRIPTLRSKESFVEALLGLVKEQQEVNRIR